MKLIDSILLSLGAAFVIIAIHQIMTSGIGNAYWITMVATALFLAYTFRKKK